MSKEEASFFSLTHVDSDRPPQLHEVRVFIEVNSYIVNINKECIVYTSRPRMTRVL